MPPAQPTPALLKKLQALGADASAVPGLQARHGRQGRGAVLRQHASRARRWPKACRRRWTRALAKLPIPKVMTYQLADGWTDVNFVRPAHGAGRAARQRRSCRSRRSACRPATTTHGHRFEAARRPVELRDADSYAAQLRRRGRGDRQLRRRAAPRSCASWPTPRAKVGGAPADRRRRAARRSHRAGRAARTCWSATSSASSSRCRRNA